MGDIAIMSWDAEQYTKLLESLLPSGRIWPTKGDDTSIMYKLLQALAEELARIDARIEDLIAEKNPRQTNELLEQFEEEFGLPESWYPTDPSYERRIEILAEKYYHAGSMTETHYKAAVRLYGNIIVFIYFTPFWCGIGCSGDPCGDQGMLSVFKVWIEFRYKGAFSDAFDNAFDRLGTPSEFIRGIIDVYKPVWTRVVYSYTTPEFSTAFGKGFDCMDSQDNHWLTGAFNKDFDYVFDRRNGGAFSFDDFGPDFDCPA